MKAIPFEIHAAWIALAAFAAILLVWRVTPWSKAPLTARGVVVIGIAWTAFCTLEYWVFGPYSALGRPDEYHASMPWVYYLTHGHPGGSYAHAYAGGLDAVAGMVTGTQHLSVERFAYAAFPLFGTVLFLKAAAIAIAFAGGYRLARSGCGLHRGGAVAVGLVASGVHIYNFAWVMGGLGWATALLPWVFYCVCVRSDRPRYFVPLAALAIVYSGSTALTHSLPALVVAAALTCALLPPARPMRCVAGAVLFCVVAVANWSGTLLAALQVAPESSRAHASPPLLSLKQWLLGNAEFFPLAAVVAALLVLALRRDRYVLVAAPVMVAAISAGTLLSWIDWKATNITVLSSYRWSLVSDAYLLPALVVVSRALSGAAHAVSRLPMRAAALGFAAIAVASAGFHKGLNLINYRFYGGQALFARVDVLKHECAWRTGDPFRVVTLPSLFSPTTASAYGLHTLDGMSNNFTRRSTDFFGMAIAKPPNRAQNVQYHWLNVPPDATEIGTAVDLAALRLANVRFVLSDRPLTDPALEAVDPRCGSTAEPGRVPSWLQRWAPRAGIERVYIYELDGAWPRAFVPAAVRVSAHDEGPEFYRELVSLPALTALVGRSDAQSIGPPAPDSLSYTLSSYSLVPDGFDLTLSRGTGGRPGIVVLNVPYSRFWHAQSNGRSVKVVPVNGVQIGLVLEDAGPQVEVRYQRPRF